MAQAVEDDPHIQRINQCRCEAMQYAYPDNNAFTDDESRHRQQSLILKSTAATLLWHMSSVYSDGSRVGPFLGIVASR
jgi:hypothetical protein